MKVSLTQVDLESVTWNSSNKESQGSIPSEIIWIDDESDQEEPVEIRNPESDLSDDSSEDNIDSKRKNNIKKSNLSQKLVEDPQDGQIKGKGKGKEIQIKETQNHVEEEKEIIRPQPEYKKPELDVNLIDDSLSIDNEDENSYTHNLEKKDFGTNVDSK